MPNTKQKVHKSDLFYLFIRKKGTQDLFELTGPIFEEGIESLKYDHFDNDPELEVFNEDTFKVVYQSEYETHFINHWAHQFYCHLNSKFNNLEIHVLTYAIGEDDEIEEMNHEKEYPECTVFEDTLIIQKVGVFKYDHTHSKIYLYADMDADATLTAKISLELHKYCHQVIEFDVFDHFYETEDGEVCLNEDAMENFNRDNLFVVNAN